MEKNTIVILILSLLIFPLALGFTSLTEMRDSQGYVTNDVSKAFYYKYDLSVSINKGWNVISTFSSPDQILSSSEITANNIKAIYYYAPLQKQYVDWFAILQGNKEMPAWWDTVDANIANGGAMWVYSNKEGTLKYWADSYKQRRILTNGWNFVAITPEMGKTDGTMHTFPVTFEQSGCSVKKVYSFDSVKQAWGIVPDFTTGANALGDEYMGLGLIMKIDTNNEYCVWIPDEQGISEPPKLPK